MDTPEDEVNLSISASACPPPFDNSDVVPIDLDVSSGNGSLYDVSDQKLETNCLGPSDVPSFTFSSWDKLPCSPMLSNRDSDAETRAGVRICSQVDEGCWLWY
jgi:hypothetical protein